MVAPSFSGDHGDMNETQDRPDQDHHRDGFDSHRLRTIADMRRSRDDRILAGVCAGAAKYLRVDPVVVRVVIAVLTFVGLAGLILYIAAWFFLPSEDADRSIAADWFNLDRNEEQVRIVGLAVAGVLAVLAIVGDNSWNWWGVPWILVPLGILYWLFVVRPRRRKLDRDHGTTPPDGGVAAARVTAELPHTGTAAEPQRPLTEPQTGRSPGSPSLTALTLSLAAIGVAVTVLVGQANGGTAWTTYVAVALGVVAVGLVVGTVFGRPGPLIPIGIVLVVVLGIGSLIPDAAIGERAVAPARAADVVGTYEHGMGKLQLDLSDVADAAQLTGSTVSVDNGMGEIVVIVPADLNVAVEATLWAGEIKAFERKVSGTDNELLRSADDPAAPALTLHLEQRFGTITVVTR